MGNEIVVNQTGTETRVAWLKNGQLGELHVDRGDRHGFVGNVYLGKVVRVLPGMQAAFVDIGLERAAFLYAGDIVADYLDGTDSDDVDEDAPQVEDELPRSSPKSGQAAIQDLIREGQEIVVQVAKDPISTKGARVTTHVTLPGRYMVFMPTVNHVGISRRIDKDKERRKLRDFVNSKRPKGAGFIVRTVCQGQPLEDLGLDMDYLMGTWDKIQTTSKEKTAPAELHRDLDLVLRIVRDHLSEDVERMVVDDKLLYERVINFMGSFMPRGKERVQLFRGQDPIFDTFGVETELSRSLGRKVWLKSGGYLIIDQTEALTAIDVNSGKFVGNTSSLEETTLLINLEAAVEIAWQLRLRNIGGIIILDFIDMEKTSNREKVYKAFEEALRADRARTNITKISELGLIEMTRKRVQEDLVRTITEPCSYCQGAGHTRSRTTMAYDILREIRREALRNRSRPAIYVNVHPAVADVMYGQELPSLERMETDLKRRIVIRAMGHYHLERFEVYSP